MARPLPRTVRFVQLAFMANKTYGVAEARAELSELLEQARRGVRVIITKHGRPYAALVPVKEGAARLRASSLMSLRGTGRGLWGGEAAKQIAALGEEWE